MCISSVVEKQPVIEKSNRSEHFLPHLAEQRSCSLNSFFLAPRLRGSIRVKVILTQFMAIFCLLRVNTCYGKMYTFFAVGGWTHATVKGTFSFCLLREDTCYGKGTPFYFCLLREDTCNGKMYTLLWPSERGSMLR